MERFGRRLVYERFFAEFYSLRLVLSETKRFFTSLRMTGSEGLRMTMSKGITKKIKCLFI